MRLAFPSRAGVIDDEAAQKEEELHTRVTSPEDVIESVATKVLCREILAVEQDNQQGCDPAAILEGAYFFFAVSCGLHKDHRIAQPRLVDCELQQQGRSSLGMSTFRHLTI
jgi:hypothetical protein